jgi:hypothetical protein
MGTGSAAAPRGLRCPLCGWEEVLHVPITRCPWRLARLGFHLTMLDRDDD